MKERSWKLTWEKIRKIQWSIVRVKTNPPLLWSEKKTLSPIALILLSYMSLRKGLQIISSFNYSVGDASLRRWWAAEELHHSLDLITSDEGPTLIADIPNHRSMPIRTAPISRNANHFAYFPSIVLHSFFQVTNRINLTDGKMKLEKTSRSVNSTWS